MTTTSRAVCLNRISMNYLNRGNRSKQVMRRPRSHYRSQPAIAEQSVLAQEQHPAPAGANKREKHEEPMHKIFRQIEQERQSQIAKDYDDAYVDAHNSGEISRAGSIYAWAASLALDSGIESVEALRDLWPCLRARFPWEDSAFRDDGPRQNLIKAATLIVCEIARMDRATENTP